MKVSYKGDYALKTMLELALNYNKGVVSIQEQGSFSLIYWFVNILVCNLLIHIYVL